MTTITTKLYNLQTKDKNDNFLADLETYDRKGDKSFIDWITQVEKIAKPTQHLEIQLSRAKVKGIVYKLIESMPLSLMWETESGIQSMKIHGYILTLSLHMRHYMNISKDFVI